MVLMSLWQSADLDRLSYKYGCALFSIYLGNAARVRSRLAMAGKQRISDMLDCIPAVFSSIGRSICVSSSQMHEMARYMYLGCFAHGKVCRFRSPSFLKIMTRTTCTFQDPDAKCMQSVFRKILSLLSKGECLVRIRTRHGIVLLFRYCAAQSRTLFQSLVGCRKCSFCSYQILIDCLAYILQVQYTMDRSPVAAQQPAPPAQPTLCVRPCRNMQRWADPIENLYKLGRIWDSDKEFASVLPKHTLTRKSLPEHTRIIWKARIGTIWGVPICLLRSEGIVKFAL